MIITQNVQISKMYLHYGKELGIIYDLSNWKIEQ